MPAPLESPKIDRLIAEVAARHGVLLKRDDAAFALVTLNQLALEDAIKGLAAEIRAATQEFESTFERLQIDAGASLARALAQAVATVRAEAKGSIAKTNGKTAIWSVCHKGTSWLLPFAVGFAIALSLRWVF